MVAIACPLLSVWAGNPGHALFTRRSVEWGWAEHDEANVEWLNLCLHLSLLCTNFLLRGREVFMPNIRVC